MKKGFTLLLLFIASISIAQESVLLKLNLNKDDKYLMKVNMLQDMGEIMKMSMKMDFPLEITNIDNNLYYMNMGISRVQSDVEQQGVTISYDSSKKEEDMTTLEKGMHDSMKKLLLFLVEMEINNQSEITRSKLLKGTGDPEQITSNATFTRFPEEPVKIGSTWSQETSSNGVKTNYTYIVKSIEKDTVTIDITGVVTESATGEVEGSLIINRHTGMVIKKVLDMNLEASGQKIASKITINTKKL